MPGYDKKKREKIMASTGQHSQMVKMQKITDPWVSVLEDRSTT